MYKINGPIFTAKYLKGCKALMYRALGGLSPEHPFNPVFPASYEPGKLPLISLSRKGIPRIVMSRHRSLMVSGPLHEQAKWVRTYATSFDLYKLILAQPGCIDLLSICQFPSKEAGVSYTAGPLTDPLGWLRLIPEVRKYLDLVPLQTGLGNRECRSQFRTGMGVICLCV